MAIDQVRLINMALNFEEDEWIREEAISDLAYFPDKESVDTLIKLINDTRISTDLMTASCETLADILSKSEIVSYEQLMRIVPLNEYKRIELIIEKYKKKYSGG